MFENVVRNCVTSWVHWTNPSSVDTEEETEFLGKVVLLDSCTRGIWDPQSLWISLNSVNQKLDAFCEFIE